MKSILFGMARAFGIGIVVVIIFGFGLSVFGSWHDEWSGYNASFRASDGYCTIAVIPIAGEMFASAMYDEFGMPLAGATLDDFRDQLRIAENDPDIDGVIVDIDSGGGSPYAGEAIANELKRSPLTSAAVIRDYAASAAYWAATGADRIFASEVSEVGSIGVTMSYLEYAGQNEDSGLRYVEIASGPYKNSGDPDRFLSDEEKEKFQESVDRLADFFVAQVALNRNLPEEEVRELADGSTFPGAVALSAGLVDELGDQESARQWFSTALQMDPADVVICE